MLDIRSESIWKLDIKLHPCLYVKVKAYEGQIVNRILAYVQLIVVGSLGSLTHKVIVSLVLGYIIGMEILGS